MLVVDRSFDRDKGMLVADRSFDRRGLPLVVGLGPAS